MSPGTIYILPGLYYLLIGLFFHQQYSFDI